MKYKSDTKKADETFEEFAHCLEDNFNKWIKIPSAKHEDVDTKRALILVIIDQFLSTVRDEQLRLKLREKKFVSLSTADEFLLHHRSNATTQPSPSKPFSRTGTILPKLSDKPDARSLQTTTGQRDTTPGQSWSRNPDQPRRNQYNVVCYRCHQLGHTESDCTMPAPPKADLAHQSFTQDKP